MTSVNPAPAVNSGRLRRHYTYLLLFSFFAALLFQLICSKSSPLYPMNDWVDVNCFFTVGKSALNGKVLYRDIYEQKGPILYFIYAAIALISDTSFIGAFIVHVIAMTLFLYFSARIVLLISENGIAACLTVVLLALFVHTTTAFFHGGSAEEMCLWMLSATLYIMAKAVKTDSVPKVWEALVIGLFAGFVLYVKYNFISFFFGIALFVLILHIQMRQFKRLFANIGAFLGGIALVSAPIFAYFAIHKAIPDFLTSYVYNNLFVYDRIFEYASNPILNRILSILRNIAKSAYYNPAVFAAIIAGIVYAIIKKPGKRRMLTLILLPFVLLAVAALWSKYYRYYCLILAPFAAFGFCWLKFKPRLISKIMVGVILVCALAGSYFLSGNTYLMKYEKEDMPQYRFAKHINEVEDATLLNYAFLDGGFYHAAQIEPTARFFCKLNVPLPEMAQEQNELIENAAVDFIVTYNFELETPDYSCIDTCEFFFEGRMFEYRLYKNVNLM